jgi:DnaA family protein
MSEQLLIDLGAPPAPSFENFMVGGNGAAVTAVQALRDGQSSTPFVSLWGPKGSGKTHLLAALACPILSPQSTVQAYVHACEGGLVAIDNVDRFDEPSQHALFNLYNQSRETGLPCIVASSTAPFAQCPVREDLRTRLAWGLVFGLSPLSDQAIIDAVQQHALTRGLTVAADVIPYVLNRFSRDMGTLMRILETLDVHAMKTKRSITVAMVRDLIQAQSRLF